MRQLLRPVAVIAAAGGTPTPPVAFFVPPRARRPATTKVPWRGRVTGPNIRVVPDETLKGVFKCLT